MTELVKLARKLKRALNHIDGQLEPVIEVVCSLYPEDVRNLQALVCGHPYLLREAKESLLRALIAKAGAA